MKWLFSLILLLPVASIGKVANAKGNEIGISVMAGEVLFPNHFRIRLKSFDLGYEWRSDYRYLSYRLWKQNMYAGFGVGGRPGEGGFVGYVGREWRYIKIIGVNVEFIAVAGSSGLVNAVGNIGVSLLW